MKRKARVAALTLCALGCGAATDAVPDDGTAGASGVGDSSAGASARDDASVEAGSPPPVAERRICDGSAGIRLAMGYGGGGQPAPYTSVLSELGYDFLYVDGTCRYWAHAPLSPPDEYSLWRPFREGVLTPADEQRLHDAVSYDGLPADGCAPEIPAADASSPFLWDGDELRECADAAFASSGPLRAALYDAAAPVTGPMRIQVGTDSYPVAPVVYAWPLAAPIDAYVVDASETRSFRIDDVAEASALRSLRAQAIADAEASSRYFLGVITLGAVEGGDRYFMSLRDELPFVGADGSWLSAAPGR